VYERTKALLTDRELYESMSRAANPYGDGKASERIVNAIRHHFGIISDRPEQFHRKFTK
ncbi:UDP-N-acetylglucosamine 2-epimerase (non-hydrolyzing), partial [Clostridium perfringens]